MTQSRARRQRPGALPEFQRAMHALGSSSATEPHTPSPHKGTRRAKNRKAIEDQQDD